MRTRLTVNSYGRAKAVSAKGLDTMTRSIHGLGFGGVAMLV